MKKFIIIFSILVVMVPLCCDQAYYRLGLYIDCGDDGTVELFVRTEGKDIVLEQDGEWTPFEIRGVDMGVGLPGEWATDYAIDHETYLRWFGLIQELGANTIRVYTILHDDFYNAFYEYNTDREAAGPDSALPAARRLGQRLCAQLSPRRI